MGNGSRPRPAGRLVCRGHESGMTERAGRLMLGVVVGLIGRIGVAALGLILLLWGIGVPLVALTGAEVEGRITHVRRQLGERNEVIPNRYAFAITYEFRLPDGTLRTGTSQRIGDFFSPGRLGVGSPVSIRYASFAPGLSVMDWRLGSLIENILAAAVGAALLWLQFKKGDRRR
jgi:hypothetical protein